MTKEERPFIKFFRERPDIFDECSDLSKENLGIKTEPWYSDAVEAIFHSKDQKAYFIIPTGFYFSSHEDDKRVLIRMSPDYYPSRNIEDLLNEALDPELKKYLLFNLDLTDKIFA